MNRNIIKALALLAVLFAAGAVHASILASASTDKNTLGENEVALLTVKLMNDTQVEATNVYLHIKADDGVVFYDGFDENPDFAKTIDSIKPGEVKELVIKMKNASASTPTASIYAYYGKEYNPAQAAVTVIGTEIAAAEANATAKSGTASGDNTEIITFTLTNTTKHSITKASAEALAPQGFDILTPPELMEVVSPSGVMQQSFKIGLPANASGNEKAIIAYGYFDNNVPHYFEKTVNFSVQKTNYPLIAVIGFLVLVAAAYLYFRKKNSGEESGADSKETAVKGSGHKK